MTTRLHDASKFSEARSASSTDHDDMASDLRIVRCRNGFMVELPHAGPRARCVVTSLDNLLEVVRTEFSPDPPAEPQEP